MKSNGIRDIRDYITGHTYWLIAKLLPRHIQEQAEYRAQLCRDCLFAGACKKCGCKTPHLFFAPGRQDKLDKWGPMMNKKDWEARKKQISNGGDIPSRDNGDTTSAEHSDR